MGQTRRRRRWATGGSADWGRRGDLEDDGRHEEEEGDSELEVDRLVDEQWRTTRGVRREVETEMGRFLAWFGMQIGGGQRHDKTQRERDATARAD